MVFSGALRMSRVLDSADHATDAAFPIFGKACVVSLLAGICAIIFSPRLLPMEWGVAAAAVGLLLWILPSRLRLLGAALFGLGWAAFHGHAGLA
jgi:competence protein ComEC